MPRIYNSFSDALDFCKRCFPNEKKAKEAYEGIGKGSDDRGDCFSYNECHPDYEECDYYCHTCDKRLTSKDN